ncbi:basic helix-loop-helix (bHLH) DNA-bindingsuperfamily protein [Striga asiatica]|uniref:Basic helix-loop-helix (BHLH) DNA-bindingsuperfamily protein n=1 Tax=Striga asiatica TaxID=4170 RepID=A0A5A7Q0X3_STRAF|nr:basic helix-loop-helix (bHLH) DNA-bindingsuperfamily protein [Striga asiatica]
MESYYTNEQAFLEELMSVREIDLSYINAINGCLNSNYANFVPNSNSSCFENSYNPNYYLAQNLSNNNSHNNKSFTCSSYGEELSPPDFTADSSGSRNFNGSHAFSGGPGLYSGIQNMEIGGPCKAEPQPSGFNVDFGPAQIKSAGKTKKISGQPSKNLMAERRRRKRLNDRLSMLRSVVPKISKMDRTSILGDTIDYMKELIERINGLQREMHLGSNQLSSMSIFNDVKPNEIVVRNSPKFDVERRNSDTRMEICCGGKPGLLLSTVTTLEALGLEIQQCVISCFNEFSLQASCSEEFKKRAMLDTEDIRQALLRNAGYGEKYV